MLNIIVAWFFTISLVVAIVTLAIIGSRRRAFPGRYFLVSFLPTLIGLCTLSIVSVLVFHPGTSSPPNNPSTNLVTSMESIQRISDTNIGVKIQVSESAVLDQSAFVVVTIINCSKEVAANCQRNNPLFVHPTPVGTPTAPIVGAFGSNYNVFAQAQLSGSAFAIDPAVQKQQSLDQRSVIFTWTLLPKFTGEQILNLDITGVWISTRTGPTLERPLVNRLVFLQVNVPPEKQASTPFFTLGQLNVTDLIVVFLGSTLNVPWIIELLKKVRKSSKPASQDKNNLPRKKQKNKRQRRPQ
ncbi:MAG TPA: hypothetical protein VFN23_05315 [Ktedonobacteraceae bacterium]|nr:hypothetical protein [Ktedonobacteraceae bacterium]